MARLVIKSSFVSPSVQGRMAHLLNYVWYIATREGVELNEMPEAEHLYQEWNQRTDLPPTVKQERLIRQLLEDFPDSRDSLEYEDYLAAPSMASASEFISRVSEDQFFEISSREGYIQYIATRPGADRDGNHGLWGATDEPLDLDESAYHVSHHNGNVWTHIISLRREDAVKTGMESAESWRGLVRSQTETFAQAMGIPATDLRWYAAFHNESHHPHIHLVAYSVGAEPYLGKKGLQEIKSGLAKEIFREELLETYQAQTQHRDELTNQWRDMLAEGDGLSQVEAQLLDLTQFLSHYKGKAVYGYLPGRQRELVNSIVDTLGKNQRIQSLYDDWYAQRDKITGIYKGEPEERVPLSQNKAFKPLKNAVIKTAIEMAAGLAEPSLDDAEPDNTTVLDWIMPELQETQEPSAPLLTTREEWLEHYSYPGPHDIPDEAISPNTPADTETLSEAYTEASVQQLVVPALGAPVEEKKKGWWTENYKYARQLLYGSPDSDPAPEEAFAAMQAEAAAGNSLAQHDLGRMLLQGIGTEIDPEAAAVQFQKALAGFKQEAQGNRPAYWQYRIGKMYAMGYGVDQNFSQAAQWYQKAVTQDNPFAAYALAGLHYRGQGVELDYEKAYHLYEMAANDEKNPSPYAKWELAKMSEQGVSVAPDLETATTWYTGAYAGFKDLESRQTDDKLAYRLGYMEYKGLGTVQDVPAAVKHFERAAQLGNPSASYYLAKIHLSGEAVPKDVSKAVELLESLKENEFYAPQATYHLGRLYLEEPDVLDLDKGISNLGLAAQQGNPYAAYKLARILSEGTLVAKDAHRAVELLEGLKDNETFGTQAAFHLGKLQISEPEVWDIDQGIVNLKFAAAEGNHFASYTLGRFYYFGQSEYRDRELGLKYLRSAAEQGNEYAVQTLDRIQVQEAKHEVKQEVTAVLGLLRLFERSLKSKRQQQQKSPTDLHQLQKEQEKKQAQGMKIG